MLVTDLEGTSGMTTLENEVTIKGKLVAIFDLITTARLWPSFYYGSAAVAGTIERPYQLGDKIFECGNDGEMSIFWLWEVVIHDRPQSVTWQCEQMRTAVQYKFTPVEGGVVFNRKWTFDNELNLGRYPDVDAAIEALRKGAQASVEMMRDKVETILAKETRDIANIDLFRLNGITSNT